MTGPDAHPVFKALTASAGEPTWSFNKYLVDREGRIVKRFPSQVAPMSDELRERLSALGYTGTEETE